MQHLCYHPCGFPTISSRMYDSMSNPGEVLRFVSNWTTCSTGCVPPRQFLWVSTLRPYSPGGLLNGLPSLHLSPKGKNAASKHTFRARTTQVSNLLRSPSFRVSVSVCFQKLAFATGVPQGINAFHYSSLSSSFSKANSILVVSCPFLWLSHSI